MGSCGRINFVGNFGGERPCLQIITDYRLYLASLWPVLALPEIDGCVFLKGTGNSRELAERRPAILNGEQIEV